MDSAIGKLGDSGCSACGDTDVVHQEYGDRYCGECISGFFGSGIGERAESEIDSLKRACAIAVEINIKKIRGDYE